MTESEVRTWEQDSFWRGYKWAITGKLPRFENEMIWWGWSFGAREFMRDYFYPFPDMSLWKRLVKRWKEVGF
jgi:hypothetical protein